MTRYMLRKLVIKPTLACTANCPTCASRKELHKKLLKSKSLSFEEWKKILSEANKLGVETFDISGGEPTLYKHLPDLIRIGRKYGWKINVNSNGSLITEEYAKRLLEAGLNTIHISLYSHIPEIHDNMRRSKGLWLKATSAIKIFAALEKEYPSFKVATQTLLCRENYKYFPELLELHYKLGSHSIALSYLEGDYEKKYLLKEDEIKYFKENIIPKAKKICNKLDVEVRDKAIDVIENMFSEDLLSISEWANGIYQPKNKNISSCQRPKEFTILLANGDVHPCNIVEYTHEPVMGNLFENSLTEIWNSKKWNNFRKNLFDKCELCPINLYMGVPLRSDRNTTRFQKFYATKIKNSKIYPFVKPLIPVYRLLSKRRISLNMLKEVHPFKPHIIDLEKSQYWPIEKLEAFQNKRLRIIINYAYNNIPGYRVKFDKAGVKPEDIKSKDDLYKLPITTREELQDNPMFVNKKLVSDVLYTGGSTGTSLRYYESKESGIIRWNAHLRGWNWHEFKPSMKYIVLKSASKIYKEGTCLYLNGNLTTENLKKNIEELIRFKPVHLKGYVNALFILAKYCLDNEIRLDGIISATPSSENMYPFQRELMEKAFNCKVFEEYCCNDGGACGWECEKREGVHHAMERAIIEEIDREMIVTDLWNMAMPFIRYRNGDSVKFLNKKCSCGRELPLMKVKGRTNDIIITNKGVITPTFLMHEGIGYDKENFKSGIRTVQYIQKPDDILEVNIIKNSWCTSDEIERFKKTLGKFTANLKIVINFVDDISKTKKMKRAFIINEDKELLKKYKGLNHK